MDFTNLTSGSQQPQRSINLSKGGRLDLSKAEPGLTRVFLGGGWDVASYGPSADLDLTAFLLDGTGRVKNVPQDIIFFNNLKAQGIYLGGDNRTGEGEGDDEQIYVELDRLPSYVEKIVFFITIFDAKAKHQTFGQVENAFVRLVNTDTNNEICKYTLSNDFQFETAVTVCSLEKNKFSGSWTFQAIGEGHIADLNDLLNFY